MTAKPGFSQDYLPTMCLFHCSTFLNHFTMGLPTMTISLPPFSIFDYAHQWLTWEPGYRKRASQLFHECWIDTMYHNLRPLVSWPDAETLKKNLSNSFKKHFSNVKCIIDCFEIYTERPVAFYARASTYSNYKKHNTLKVLIGIAPTGAITFISKAWTGRISDKVITQKCGFLDHLEYGDVVLADRGFNVHDEEPG